MRKGFALDLIVLSISLAAFGFLSLQQLDLPGLYYDEAADAIPAMQLVLGQKVEIFNQTGLLIGNLSLPVMTMDYVGTVNTYLLVPLFALLGVDVVSLRLLTVLGSGLTVVLSYFIAKELFDRPTAAATALLLAVHPSFVFWSRQGIHVTSIMTVMSTASLLSLLIWRRRRHPVFLYLAALFLGLGLSAKFLFLWFILALAGSAFVLLVIPRLLIPIKTVVRGLVPRRGDGGQIAVVAPFTGAPGRWEGGVPHPPPHAGVKPATTSSTPGCEPPGPCLPDGGQAPALRRDEIGIPAEIRRGAGHRKLAAGVFHLAVCSLFFALGAWMILFYNALTRGTIAVLTQNLTTTSYGVNNLAFTNNLLTALGDFRVYLRGENFWYLGGLFANDWYPKVFAIAALGTLTLLIHPKVRRRWRSFLFPLVMLALIVVQSCFTISGLWATHFFIAYPFPQLAIAAFVVAVGRLLPLKRVAAVIAVVALAVFISKDVYVNFRYHRVLANTGGMFTHSDAVYRLAEYLDGREVAEPIAMDWGIKTSVQILTQGRINPIEIFQYDKEPNAVFFDWLYGSLTQRPNTLYVFHAEGSEVFPRYEAFTTLARKLDKKVNLEQTILARYGVPLYVVYSAR